MNTRSTDQNRQLGKPIALNDRGRDLLMLPIRALGLRRPGVCDLIREQEALSKLKKTQHDFLIVFDPGLISKQMALKRSLPWAKETAMRLREDHQHRRVWVQFTPVIRHLRGSNPGPIHIQVNYDGDTIIVPRSRDEQALVTAILRTRRESNGYVACRVANNTVSIPQRSTYHSIRALLDEAGLWSPDPA